MPVYRLFPRIQEISNRLNAILGAISHYTHHDLTLGT